MASASAAAGGANSLAKYKLVFLGDQVRPSPAVGGTLRRAARPRSLAAAAAPPPRALTRAASTERGQDVDHHSLRVR